METGFRRLGTTVGALALPALLSLAPTGQARSDFAAAPPAHIQASPGHRSFRVRHARAHLYVSPTGSDRGICRRSRPCRTISRAVVVAHAGDEIDVRPGSYPEEVVLTKPLVIKGLHAPEIDAQGRANGVLIKGPRAAGSEVSGLVLENATYEGILALRTRRVTIANNVVRHDDQGFYAAVLTGECEENGIPGPHVADLRAGGCGEGIHLASTSDSRVTRNLVTDNTGGIYLTDESAPAAHNLIDGNLVLANLYDCGITLASHSKRAVSLAGRLRPGAGGVYDNTIRGNVADLNGVRRPGAGILVAAAFPGSAAYGNRIIANEASRNGLPGIALHSHGGRQDLNDNVIQDNVIGLNAIGGSTGGPGDGDGGVTHTTGILVWSSVTKIRRIRIAGNRITDDYFGIWTRHAPHLRRSANRYRRVRVPVMQRV
jgi:parallel beta-helix repeat protein